MKKNGGFSKKAICRIVLLIFISLFIGISVYGWNAKNLVGNHLPMPFGYGSAVVLSGSMEPALSVNDWIIVKNTKSYEIGDMIVFQSGGDLIVHRVIAVDGETVQTKGDANTAPDTPIMRSQVKGKVIACIPGAGVLIRGIQSPAGIAVILAAAVFLMEASYRKDRQKDEDELERLKDEIRKLKEDQE